MCGIAGFVELGRSSPKEALARTAQRMTDALFHRGPDAGGVWVNENVGVALGNRRLSIIDLSPNGAQPMVSSDGRLVIVYNGEIYNAAELRAELRAAGRPFRGHSDTEILLEASAAWGVEEAVTRIEGMFSAALYDRGQQTLTLVRDRLGIKPLYWAHLGDLFLFGSELKSLVAHGGWAPELDLDAVAAFLRFAYVPSPHSIYKGVNKLESGHILTYCPGQAPRTRAYWSMRDVAVRDPAERMPIGELEAVDRLEALLTEVVDRHMVSDVPLGAFLSGGIDSSLVTALMQARSSRPVQTFTIGSDSTDHDESETARAVARHLGCEHVELIATPKRALDLIPKLTEIYDEPFADPSEIPAILLAQLAGEHITVILTGDGGDEIFGGYSRYVGVELARHRLGWLPRIVRRSIGSGTRAIPPHILDRAFSWIPPRVRPRLLGEKLHRVAGIIELDDPDEMYRRVVSRWQNPGRVVRHAKEPRTIAWDAELARQIPDFVERMMFLDTVTYLTDDCLTKVDRATMASSLEARVPLLDHKVVEFAWRLPRSFHVDGTRTKRVFRSVLYRYVPPHLVERPKAGFSVPVADWLRGPLRDWAENLLERKRLLEQGIFDPDPIHEEWRAHLSGQSDRHTLLWIVLVFQSWLERSQ